MEKWGRFGSTLSRKGCGEFEGQSPSITEVQNQNARQTIKARQTSVIGCEKQSHYPVKSAGNIEFQSVDKMMFTLFLFADIICLHPTQEGRDDTAVRRNYLLRRNFCGCPLFLSDVLRWTGRPSYVGSRNQRASPFDFGAGGQSRTKKAGRSHVLARTKFCDRPLIDILGWFAVLIPSREVCFAFIVCFAFWFCSSVIEGSALKLPQACWREAYADAVAYTARFASLAFFTKNCEVVPLPTIMNYEL